MHPDDAEAALTDYEQAMFPRSTKVATEAAELHESLSGDNAVQSLINMLTAHKPTP